MRKVAICVGTRPDIIKMWSTYDALKKTTDLDTILIHSGQHDAMGIQAMETFSMFPNHTLTVNSNFKLGHVVSRLIDQFTIAFYELKPDLVLVHGDTSTAFSAAVAAFLQNIPIGHVEAGLRTSRFEYPFPEEGYRRIISRITTLHFSPTPRAAMNLREEGINKNIFCTGNTVVDALKHILKTPDTPELSCIAESFFGTQFVLVTCHRRESYGQPLDGLIKALTSMLDTHPSTKLLWPVHPNPNVQDKVKTFYHNNLYLCPPLGYNDFVKIMEMASLIITDSGGVMEEAAVLGKPTLVLRTETERPEVLFLDNVRLVGYDFDEMLNYADIWLKNPPKAEGSSAFGDGTAGMEISRRVEEFLCTAHDVKHGSSQISTVPDVV